ncbi:phosphodiester glycosidase family protein [Phenylobacterium sp.]|uniref:phosphodiester glycosidase family protein n=1 Tax=Phenylobacterium sp. TaxID=1871053 RepID=UPI002E2EDBEC|nr:phosphodiester glycosidase family protein [Phenylobacterium sp.]HEX2559522.1 phosphodiester glycosidase family protein [Phenylobacterium sp.]
MGLAGAGAVLAAGAARLADDPPCRIETFEGARFTVCAYRPERHELRLAWRDRSGAPLRTLARLAKHLGPEADSVRFAMNAGMYEPDLSPVGLHVEQGRLLRPLNTADAAGNFYLKPNGVFFVGNDGRAAVATAEAYARRTRSPAWATQSGPMLLVGGELHPRIQPDGASRLVRNGVGAGPDGEALFVISEGPVSFGKLARFFRDGLGCKDALYLDGTVSQLWAPRQGRRDRGPALGPMVVVLDRG